MVNAWTDTSQNEIAWSFGAPLGSTDTASADTSEYNQVINGHIYYIQQMFSNADYAKGPDRGCVQSEAQAQANATAGGGGTGASQSLTEQPASAARTGSVDVVSVSSQAYGLQGGKRTRVTVHVGNTVGSPVANDHIVVDLTADTNETNTCGSLSHNRGYTDAAGNFVNTYTAAAESTECALIAIEGRTGQHGMGTLYLGKDIALCPTALYKAPSSLKTGHAALFTAAMTNSGDALTSTVTQVSISGDDNRWAGGKARRSGFNGAPTARAPGGRWICSVTPGAAAPSPPTGSWSRPRSERGPWSTSSSGSSSPTARR